MEQDYLGYADFIETEWAPREARPTRDTAHEVDPVAIAHAQSADAQILRLN